MPASGKMLKSREQAANRAAGIGDEQGRLPARIKAAEVMANCTICSGTIRMTKKNIEAKAHFDSRHPTSTFSICFPGQFDPTVAPAAGATMDGLEEGAGKKIDIDAVRGEAARARSLAEGGEDKTKPKPKKADLSFLDAALDPKKKK